MVGGMTAAVALLCGVGVGFGCFLVVAALRGARVLPAPGHRHPAGGTLLRTVAVGVGAATATYLVTGWVVAALASALAAVVAPRWLSGGSRHRGEIARVEAIAAWAEQLRDTLAAANGLEHAIAASGPVAPPAIAAPVARLAARVSYEPLPAALRRFADEVDHPTADFVVAGLLVAAEREARDLGPLLGQLAECARAEAQMRARVWAGRARTRTSVRVIAAAVALFAAGLLVLDRSYLTPYDSPGGQVALAVVAGIFGGSLWAMDRMSRIALPDRFLGRRPVHEVAP
jgi:Flp pilus assembly protein TadB